MTSSAEKLSNLLALLSDLGSAVVGFSGGVDSTFLSAAAYRSLGEKAVAVTAFSPTLPESERLAATQIAEQIGIQHVFLPISELSSADFVANDKNRCYFCKRQRFSVLSDWAYSHGYQWVLEGANADDIGDYRPGMRAVAELEAVRSPLLEVGLMKQEIREISKAWGLPTWNKLSGACLSSRVPYGQLITEEKLRQIEQAEESVKLYCSGQVRVRHHGDLARIEVSPEDIAKITSPEVREKIYQKLKQVGFTFVTVDLAGYRMGSLNDLLVMLQ